jgi:pimeloyl-ACP methyl ester carboxylesterase
VSGAALVGIDLVFTPEEVGVRAADYVGSADPSDPSVSPIFADLHGVAPILVEIYYEDHGSGPPVVLLSGWPLDSRSWEPQLLLLLQAGNRVILLRTRVRNQ